MAGSFFTGIPQEFIHFLLVALFSLLIGLEQRRHFISEQTETLFGTDRTFTLIGILGFALYSADTRTLIPFLGGGAVIGALLTVYYYQKIAVHKLFGLTSLIIALITYSLAPIVCTQSPWMAILIVVCVLVITEIKDTLLAVSKKFDDKEFITLAKFLALAGVILPLLPDKVISATFNVSPFKLGLAIVAVSGISYLSYLLKKFVFPNSGIMLTGILGGLYSSTATTFILARKSRETGNAGKTTPAIILATAMMYLRLFLLCLFFNITLALKLLPAFLTSFIVAIAIAAFMWRQKGNAPEAGPSQKVESHGNPLELKTSLIFGTLFIVFAVVTGLVNSRFGAGGINVLAFVVGVTDIDPFIINLFQGSWNLDMGIIVTAVLNAISSNNLLKMIYAVTLSEKTARLPLIIGFAALIAVGLLFSFVIHF